MVKNPSRDQRTPGRSHSTRSYLETGMGLTERLDRDGRESFGPFKGLSVLKNLVEKITYGRNA